MFDEQYLLDAYPQFVVDNKYARCYLRLCNRALERTLEKGMRYEGHHVIPEFLRLNHPIKVKLSIREHVLAHILLTFMLVGLNRATAFYSLKSFTMDANGTRTGIRTNTRFVEWYRRAYVTPEWSAAVGKKVSEARMVPDVNAKITQISIDLWKDPEYRDKVSNAQKAAWKDDLGAQRREIMGTKEVRLKISEGTKIAMARPEIREKYEKGYNASRENRHKGICTAWADPIKKAARLEKNRLTAERKRLLKLESSLASPLPQQHKDL